MIELLSIIHEFRDVVVGVYTEGFHNKILFLDTVLEEVYDEANFIDELGEKINKPMVENVEYKWCHLTLDENGEEYLTFSDKEETGSFGVTALYW